MLRQLQPQSVAFDLRRLLLYSPSPMRSALIGYFTDHHVGTITCVYRGAARAGHLRGFAQVWPRPGRAEWELAFLAPALDQNAHGSEVWQRLLSSLIVLAAEQNIQHIYARSAEDAEVEDVLRQVGFTLLAREEIFVLTQPPASAPAPEGLRRLVAADRCALAEFYRQVVPQLVQQAEGFAPRWGHSLTLAWPSATQEYAWVEEGRILAYLGLCSSARGHWLEVVVRPEQRANVLPHIKQVLALAAEAGSRPVYCPVPDEEVGLGWLLRTVGFETYTRQALLVAHTVARVPVRRPWVVPGLERGRAVPPVHNAELQ